MIKTKVDKKIILKELGAEMCADIGVDPQFLDNKPFQELSFDTKSTPKGSTKPPMASISFSNSKTMPYYEKKATISFCDNIKHDFNNATSCEGYDTIQFQRPREYAQIAEAGISNSYKNSSSIENQRSFIPIWGVAFIVSTGLYLLVISKLKNNAWYNKNFNSDHYKIEKLAENQEKILENQNQILELLKKKNLKHDMILIIY